MEYEDIANLSNSTEPVSPMESYRYIAHEILFSIFAVFAIAADLLIIYTIFHFQRLHTVANMFLANWAIADLASLFITPSAYRIVSIIAAIPLPRLLFCVLFDAGAILHGLTILFVILVAIDWIISAYFRQASNKFRKTYRYLIGGLWSISLLLASVSFGLCCTEKSHDDHLFILLLPVIYVFAMFILVLCVQIIRLVQKLRKRPSDVSSLPIKLVTAYSTCWILAILNIIFGVRYVRHPLMEIVSCLLIFSSSLVNLGCLCYFNKDFRASLLEVCECVRVRHREDHNARAIDNSVANSTISIAFNKPGSRLVNSEI